MKVIGRILFLVTLFSCKKDDFQIINPPIEDTNSVQTISEIQDNLEDSNSTNVMVVAHRGAWKNAPENSISSIEHAIELGVDIVELDIRITSDNALILMHDNTVDRMTDGSGRVEDLTLAEIKSLYLRNRNGGALTDERVPTLAEASKAAKGKIMLRIDKSYDFLDQVVEVLVETETLDHATLMVPKSIQPGNVIFSYGDLLDEVYFSPIIDADGAVGPSQVSGYQAYPKVTAFESSFSNDQNIVVNFNTIKENGSRVMVYTGTSGSSGGHDDRMALTNIDLAYGWLIEQGVNMIQTDEPALLLQYLRLKNLHR